MWMQAFSEGGNSKWFLLEMNARVQADFMTSINSSYPLLQVIHEFDAEVILFRNVQLLANQFQ